MKKLFGLLVILGITMASVPAHALSFTPDTIFLNANTQEACDELGGSFIEWYGETYCTTMPATLTTTEKAKVIIVANKILELIKDNGDLYEQVMTLLETYKTKFTEQGDMKKLAIANLLIDHITEQVTLIPDNCTLRYDGCNNCIVGENGELACTKMACLVQQEPMCKVYETTIIIADHTEACVGVGPMECMLVHELPSTYRPGDPVPGIGITREQGLANDTCGAGTTLEDGECVLDTTDNGNTPSTEHNRVNSRNRGIQANAVDGDWKYFYDTIEGFEYIPGYTWTLRVEATHLDTTDLPADASSISWKLKEVLAITAEVPESCSSWYDGCNTCSVGENGLMACTMMACMGEPMMPYCMDDDVDSTKATDYNSSRSNKSY